jgi:hypothetical protein
VSAGLSPWILEAVRWAYVSLFTGLEEPFSVGMQDDLRRFVRIRLTGLPPVTPRCVEAYEAFEPHPIWQEPILRGRAACYREGSHPLARRAERDLARFRRTHSPSLADLVLMGVGPPGPERAIQ